MRTKRAAIAITLVTTLAAWPTACGTSAFTNDAALDGSTSVDGAVGADVTNEASANDAVVPDGATADFCKFQNSALICADFDETDLRTAFVRSSSQYFFSVPVVDDGGTFGRLDGGASLPFALGTSLAKLDDAGTKHEALTTGTLSGVNANHFTLKAALQFLAVGDFSSAYTLVFLSFTLSNGPSTQFNLGIRQQHVRLDIGNGVTTYGSFDLGSPPANPNAWVPFALDITLGPSGVFTAALDTTVVSGPSAALQQQTDTKLELGPNSFGYTGGVGIGFDNVMLFASDDALPDGGVARDE